MKTFIKAFDEKAWRAILIGWSHPTKTDDQGETVSKLELEWSAREDKLAMSNSKALNTIFNAVDSNQFKLISTCESAKNAWDVLQTAYEGTNMVMLSRLQLLTTKFENLKMRDEENIGEFNARLCDIANEAFALSEKMPEEKLVSKTLRSLPKRFAYKVMAIEEAKDMRTMKLEKLMESRRTFEMILEEEHGEKINKGIALKADTDNDDSETRRSSNDGPQHVPGTSLNNRNYNPSGNVKPTKPTPDSRNRGSGIWCRECDGFGHIQSECTNTLKKNNKTFNTIWSDGDFDRSRDDEYHISHHIALTTWSATEKSSSEDPEDVPAHDSVSSDGEVLTNEAIIESYRTMYQKWLQVVKINERLRK